VGCGFGARRIRRLCFRPRALYLLNSSYIGTRSTVAGYAQYVALEIETACDLRLPMNMRVSKKGEKMAGLGFGPRANFEVLFLPKHRKFSHSMNGGVIFMLSAALIL